MSLLEKIKIRSKILLLILPVSAIGLVGVGVVANNYKNADAAYSDFIAKDNVAATLLARANTSLVGVTYNAYQLLAYDAHSAYVPDIRTEYDASKIALVRFLDEAAALTPQNQAELGAFRQKAVDVLKTLDQAVASASKGDQAAAKSLLAQSDPAVAKWRADLRKWNDANLDAIVAKSDFLTAQTKFDDHQFPRNFDPFVCCFCRIVAVRCGTRDYQAYRPTASSYAKPHRRKYL